MNKNEHTEKRTTAAVVSAFILKNRIVLISVLSVLIISGVGVSIFIVINQSIREKGFVKLDAIEHALTEENLEETAETVSVLASKNAHNPVGARAYLLLADIRFSQKNWDEAKTAYLAAVSANPKAYTSPVCYYNAAVCSEELSDYAAAAELYAKAVASKNFPLVPRALFNLARLADEQSDYATAVKYYDEVASKYPADQWASLAKSRALALRAQGKIE